MLPKSPEDHHPPLKGKGGPVKNREQEETGPGLPGAAHEAERVRCGVIAKGVERAYPASSPAEITVITASAAAAERPGSVPESPEDRIGIIRPELAELDIPDISDEKIR